MATVAALGRPLASRVSWGALFAGFFFGFGIWTILLALGAGIGLASFDPQDMTHWQGLGIGFGIWGVVSGIIAMFVAGWLTARLSVADTRPAGMLHGAALWGFMLVAGLWVATLAVARTAGAAASAAGGAAQTAVQAGASNPRLQQQAEQRAEAAKQQVQQGAQQLRQEVEQNKDQAAQATKLAGATGAWAYFIYGLLTLAAAILGGRQGIPRGRAIIHEEPAPVPGAPLTPQRA
jgi:hypothetical protein